MPVVETKKTLSQPGTQGVIVLVDNFIAVQNLEKMAAGLGYGFSFEQKGETEYAATIFTKDSGNQAVVPQPDNPVSGTGGTVFLFTGDQIGISSEEPGKKLMQSFLYSLAQLPEAPKALLLMNTGVKLACEGSETLEELKTLCSRGTDIRSCGQCLNYYELSDKLAVGKITNMLDIVETLASASRTITL
jgi:selenium metabolism protein YedF